MPRLTEYTSYADAQRHFSRDALWELFDGNRERFNIGHECLDRHPPGQIAVRVAHADGGDEAHSFGALAEGSNRFAHWLQSQGHQKGEPIAILMEPCLAFYLALFGVMKAGCVAVPLFTLFGPDGLRLRIEDCHPRLLLTSQQHAALAQTISGPRVVVMDEAFLTALAGQPAAFTPRTAADDMALFQYTSGTTRELPEAVRHRHRALVVVMIAALYGTGVRPGDQFMCPSSPAWGHGLWHGTLAPLALGVSIAAYAGQFDPARLMQALADYEITNLSAAATHYRMMKRMMKNAAAGERGTGAGMPAIDGRAIKHLEKLSFTGEPLDSATAEWARGFFGHSVCSIYGTTELGVVIADYPGAADHRVKPGAMGRPVPGVDVAIHDARGRDCPPGVAGDIVVRRGGAWAPTRDRGHVDSEGYYFHGGRSDDVIISAGWTMSAVEIEDVLLKHEDVAEAAVIGVPDQLRGLVVKAFIVSPRHGSDDFATELQTFVQQRLSRHEYPRLVAFTDALPKTEAGKVNRKALRDAEQEQRKEKPS